MKRFLQKSHMPIRCAICEAEVYSGTRHGIVLKVGGERIVRRGVYCLTCNPTKMESLKPRN